MTHLPIYTTKSIAEVSSTGLQARNDTREMHDVEVTKVSMQGENEFRHHALQYVVM